MKNIKIQSSIFFIAFVFLLSSCEEFVEVDVPDHITTSATVFADDETAKSAMTGIYNQLFNANFANGGNRSVTFLAGLSADNFIPTTNILEILEFSQNAISPANSWNFDLWASGYNMIYMTNALLEGISNSSGLTEETAFQLEGEAKFVRAFTYWNLVNLYGDVPLLTQTEYDQNGIAPRQVKEIVIEQIIGDLEGAMELLDSDYENQDRTKPNRFTAMALLARVYLYKEDWQQAEYYSSQVISQASLYALLENPAQVFLANSREAIWQISPIGWGSSFTHTREGNLFIRNSSTITSVTLSEDFIETWSGTEDLRFINWIGIFQSENEVFYYPYKYKIQYDASGGEISEYSMVLRLAEQYLIRAEARAKQGNISGALEDVNTIRARAGLTLIEGLDMTQQEILEIILKERRKEFFAEWGHRWFDLKRTGNSDYLLDKPNADWEATDIRYPIPEQERMKNSNLTQNPGY